MIVLPPFGKTKNCITSFQLWQRYWYSYRQILNGSILNTIPTEINGFCQGSADYPVARGTNAGEAKQNLRWIPGEQSSSLSFLDPPLWTCISESVKALLLNWRSRNISSLFAHTGLISVLQSNSLSEVLVVHTQHLLSVFPPKQL